MANELDTWLTIAVPIYSDWPDVGMEFAQGPDLPEETVRAALKRHIEALDRGRVHGLLVRTPIATALLRRVDQAEHEVIVVPGGLRHLGTRLPLGALCAAPLVKT